MARATDTLGRSRLLEEEAVHHLPFSARSSGVRTAASRALQERDDEDEGAAGVCLEQPQQTMDPSVPAKQQSLGLMSGDMSPLLANSVVLDEVEPSYSQDSRDVSLQAPLTNSAIALANCATMAADLANVFASNQARLRNHGNSANRTRVDGAAENKSRSDMAVASIARSIGSTIGSAADTSRVLRKSLQQESTNRRPRSPESANRRPKSPGSINRRPRSPKKLSSCGSPGILNRSGVFSGASPAACSQATPTPNTDKLRDISRAGIHMAVSPEPSYIMGAADTSMSTPNVDSSRKSLHTGMRRAVSPEPIHFVSTTCSSTSNMSPPMSRINSAAKLDPSLFIDGSIAASSSETDRRVRSWVPAFAQGHTGASSPRLSGASQTSSSARGSGYLRGVAPVVPFAVAPPTGWTCSHASGAGYSGAQGAAASPPVSARHMKPPIGNEGLPMGQALPRTQSPLRKTTNPGVPMMQLPPQTQNPPQHSFGRATSPSVPMAQLIPRTHSPLRQNGNRPTSPLRNCTRMDGPLRQSSNRAPSPLRNGRTTSPLRNGVPSRGISPLRNGIRMDGPRLVLGPASPRVEQPLPRNDQRRPPSPAARRPASAVADAWGAFQRAGIAQKDGKALNGKSAVTTVEAYCDTDRAGCRQRKSMGGFAEAGGNADDADPRSLASADDGGSGPAVRHCSTAFPKVQDMKRWLIHKGEQKLSI